MLNFDFHNPTHIAFGQGSITDLAQLVPAAAKVLILVGGASAEKTGTPAEVRANPYVIKAYLGGSGDPRKGADPAAVSEVA